MSNVMPQIHNVVLLMLENRSLDNLLGWLYEGSSPANFHPKENRSPYDGLAIGKYSNPAKTITEGVKNYPVEKIPSANAGQAIPWWDPYEAMREGPGQEWNGVLNQLYGNQDIISAMPQPNTPSPMKGFLQDYYTRKMVQWQGLDILWTYTARQAKWINALAGQYAVSDRWFCSIPTQTNPNRAFSLCGTSLGRENNAPLAKETFDHDTLFNWLASKNKSWGLYYLETWLNTGKCFTDYTFPHIARAPGGEIKTFDTFMAKAAAGKLPAFSYIEPKWGYGINYETSIQGNDYHPPTLIGPGELFLRNIYKALRSSPQWPNTLFIVTFDEHGGTYDHVAPPWGAINPDGKIGTKFKFGFNQFGARVPTLLISPFVRPQTVFRQPTTSTQPFDHTSVIRTLLEWAGVPIDPAKQGKRTAAAPLFDGVLESKAVNPGLDLTSTAEQAEDGTGSGAQPSVDPRFAGVPPGYLRILYYLNTAEDGMVDVQALARDAEAFRNDPEAEAARIDKEIPA